MEQETMFAEALQISEENARCDAACKRILSEKSILAWILKSCTEEFRSFDVEEIAAKYIDGDPQIDELAVPPDAMGNPSKITGLNTEDSSLTEGKIVYDIRFYAALPSSGEKIRLIINIEAQGQFFVGYPVIKRAIYYCSRLISSQYNSEFEGPKYQDIKKVYSIWIVMNPPKERENTITRYRIVEENMVGSVKEPVRNYDLMSAVMVCLGDPEQEDSNILRLLNVVFSNKMKATEKKRILSADFHIPMTKKLEGGLNDMGGICAGYQERGWREGIAEGIAKGKVEGILENTVASIKNLTETLGLSAESAMAALKIPASEQQKYLELLEKQ